MDLITLQEYRDATRYTTSDASYDAQVTAAIKYATAVIRAYTGRDFGVALVAEDRTFAYDGSGYLDIDDAQEITAAALVVEGYSDQVLDPQLWVALPGRRDDAPVYTYVYLPGVVSPAVKVSGTWGWSAVPDDVKQATIWTVEDWIATTASSAGPITAHAIESFSESFGSRSGGAQSAALPGRALDVLAAYAKVNV